MGNEPLLGIAGKDAENDLICLIKQEALSERRHGERSIRIMMSPQPLSIERCLVPGFPSISVTLVVVGVGPLSGKGLRIIVFADASVLPRLSSPAICCIGPRPIYVYYELSPSPQHGSPYQSQQYSNNQSSTPLSITYPSNDYQSSVHHNVYSLPSSIPQLEYAPTVNQQPEFPQLDSGLIVLVFQKGDDPIDAINHMMSFLTAVVTSRYPNTNNHLRNSSNPKQQATINDGRVTLQPVQGRQTSFDAGTTRTYTLGVSESNSGKQMTVTCYNCKGEGHMSKQCTKPKRRRDESWFKDKVLLVQAQANDQILHEEELAFLVALGIAEVALMANLSHYGSDALAELNVVNHSETEITSDSNIIPYSQYKEQVKVLKEGQNIDLNSKDNILDSSAQSVEIDRLKQPLSEHLKEKDSLMQTVTLLKNDFKKEESKNIDREIALENRIKQLDNIVFKRDQSTQTVHMLTKPQFFYDHTTKQALGFQNPFYLKKAQQLEPKLYDGNVIKNTSAIVILDSEETLMLAEENRSKMFLKQQDPMMLEKKVITTPVDYANSVNSSDPTLSSRPTKVEVPKELPKVSMVNTSTDISKIIRNQSKTGKHGQENQKSTKEGKERKSVQKPEAKPGKVKPSVKVVKSWSTKVNH
ncbi:retrovirus-related pol polyprotein from transposon TNT 1-94 [Tanacetum coccineum]|uniref:Retrovirus-related pol polyprotein from transposon TNT 1-94 n=1 Tax=Tanacetum coccineum TaxID=301880 RepID=A0ABQ5DDW2_9ASTR